MSTCPPVHLSCSMLHPPEKALTPAPCPAPPPLASEQLDFWIDDFDAQGRALPHYPGCACREHPSRVARLGLAATLEAAPSAGGADNELARACAGALAGAVGFRSNCRAVCVGADGLSATHTGSYGWSSAFGTQPANASSSMCWSIEVMARSDEENAIMVGVCRAEAASSGCVGGERLFATQEAWAINCADGALWGNGKIDANRAGRVPTGSLLTCCLDMDAGTLNFSVNGRRHGRGHVGIDCAVIPYIEMCNHGDSVRLARLKPCHACEIKLIRTITSASSSRASSKVPSPSTSPTLRVRRLSTIDVLASVVEVLSPRSAARSLPLPSSPNAASGHVRTLSAVPGSD